MGGYGPDWVALCWKGGLVAVQKLLCPLTIVAGNIPIQRKIISIFTCRNGWLSTTNHLFRPARHRHPAIGVPFSIERITN